MKEHLDTRMSGEEMALLKGAVGNTFEKMRYDRLQFSDSTYGTLGMFVGGHVYELTDYFEVEDYFGYVEEVDRLKLRECKEADIKAAAKAGTLVDVSVNDVIRKIILVQDHEIMTKSGEPYFDHWYTKAIIFCFDGHQLGFEGGPYSTEVIDVLKGVEVLSKLDSFDRFYDPADGYEETGERIIVTLE